MQRSSVYMEDLAGILSEDHPWESLSGSSILVTGATGLVGSILVDVLSEKSSEYGFDVVAMSRNGPELESMFGHHAGRARLEFLEHDVNIPLHRRFDSIFHLASNTHPRLYSSDPVGTVTTNVIGLHNLLEHSKGGDGRFVFASSVEVYGENRGDVSRFDEGYCGYIDCNTLRAGYNESKRLGESLCQAYGSRDGLDFVIPRFSRLYGPSMRMGDTKAISQFIKCSLAGEDIVLKSKGDQLFSYCYSADAVSAMLHIFFNGRSGEAYNVAGAGEDMTMRQIAEYMAEVTGTGVRFEIPDEQESRGYSKATRALLDIGKIADLGWTPTYTLRDGIKRTLDSFSCRSVSSTT